LKSLLSRYLSPVTLRFNDRKLLTMAAAIGNLPSEPSTSTMTFTEEQKLKNDLQNPMGLI